MVRDKGLKRTHFPILVSITFGKKEGERHKFRMYSGMDILGEALVDGVLLDQNGTIQELSKWKRQVLDNLMRVPPRIPFKPK